MELTFSANFLTSKFKFSTLQTLYFCCLTAIAKSPKKNSGHDKSEYFPFGRPGGGAPIRDQKGKLRTGVTGMVENEKMVGKHLKYIFTSVI